MMEIPEFYADQFRVTVGAYTVTMTLSMAPAHPQPGVNIPRDLAVVRMSPEHAKVLAMVLRRSLKNHERETGATINVAPQILNQLSLSVEDW